MMRHRPGDQFCECFECTTKQHIPARLLSAVSGSGARDWPEDFPGENGNYQNRCCYCQQTFIGHKRRTVCRECFEESKRKFLALSPEEREALLAKQCAEVAKWVEEQRANKHLNEQS